MKQEDKMRSLVIFSFLLFFSSSLFSLDAGLQYTVYTDAAVCKNAKGDEFAAGGGSTFTVWPSDDPSLIAIQFNSIVPIHDPSILQANTIQLTQKNLYTRYYLTLVDANSLPVHRIGGQFMIGALDLPTHGREEPFL